MVLPIRLSLIFGLLVIASVQAIGQCSTGRYLNPIFSSTRTHENVQYNQAYALQGACAIETNQTISYYNLDVYEPDGDTIEKRPCIVYAHGGAFLIGDKRIVPVDQYCYEMAKRGFVVFSIDYRKCFNTVSTPSIERAVYRAVQDMNAAIRWVKAKADTFGVDTNLIFAGGNSAGSIMAIFSTYGDEYERAAIPSTYNNPDLGCMDCSGNYYPGPSKAKAVLNYWGATLDTNIIEAGDPPMLSMHGNADNAVPYENGVPFSYPAFPPVHGSLEITARLNHLGITNQLYVFEGMGHEPWLTDPNQLDTIVEKSSQFLYDLFLKPSLPQVVGAANVCIGDTINYTVNGGSQSSDFCWQVTNGVIVGSNGNNSSIQVAWNNLGNAGLSVNEENQWQGSSDIAMFPVNVHPYPAGAAGSDTAICEGQSVQLYANGGTSYAWMPDSNLSNANIANPAAYPVHDQIYTVAISNGTCVSYDSVEITVNPLPFVFAGQDVHICPGGDAQLDGWAQGQLYIWSPNSTLDHPYFIHPIATPQITTVYTLTTIDTTTGCQDSDQATVFIEQPAMPDIFQQGDTLVTYLGFTYQWSLNGSLIPNATNHYYVPLVSGGYSVEVTDSFGCSNESIMTDVVLGIEGEQADSFSIYPNPARDELFVQGVNGFIVHLREMMGREIKTWTIKGSADRLDISFLPSGVYFLHVEGNEVAIVHKFVKR